jgi:hypothetical protein
LWSPFLLLVQLPSRPIYARVDPCPSSPSSDLPSLWALSRKAGILNLAHFLEESWKIKLGPLSRGKLGD